MEALYTFKNSKAICWLDDDNLLLYKNRSFYSYNFVNKVLIKKAKIKAPPLTSLLSYCSLSRRLFRLYPFASQFIKKTNELLFSFRGAIYCLDLNQNTISKETALKHEASKTLSICVDENGDAFFGEYPTKNDDEPVCIFKRNKMKKWEPCYCFSPNSIRHIHLIKVFNNDLFCFTGDEDREVNVFCFKNKRFDKEPLRIVGGSQKYRTCIATLHNSNIYYLTDTPYFENKLYCYNILSGSLEEKYKIEGTVIYGFEDNNRLYFSTSVEYNLQKDENDSNVIIAIDGKAGGIKSEYSSVYAFDFSNSSLTKLFSLKKDCLSIKCFGIGTFTFPCCFSNKYIATTSSSLKSDETIFIFERE